MPEPPTEGAEPTPPIRDNLLELARRIRDVDHLEPEVGAELADLLGELAGALEHPAPSAQADHLAQSAAHLARALEHQAKPGPIAEARRRLEDAAANAEVRAPVATGIVRRMIAALADLGI